MVKTERLMEGLDELIERLLEGRKNRGKKIQLTEAEIRQLCVTSKDIFLSQPNLLELEAPINVCGMFFFFVNIYAMCSIRTSVYLAIGNAEVALLHRLLRPLQFHTISNTI